MMNIFRRLFRRNPPKQGAVVRDGYRCRCHEHMGNDFWFLPTGSCLFAVCDSSTYRKHEEEE